MSAIRPADYPEKVPDILTAAQREAIAGHRTAAQQEMTPDAGQTKLRVQTDAKTADRRQKAAKGRPAHHPKGKGCWGVKKESRQEPKAEGTQAGYMKTPEMSPKAFRDGAQVPRRIRGQDRGQNLLVTVPMPAEGQAAELIFWFREAFWRRRESLSG